MIFDITQMVADSDDMPMLSGSAFELGDNAGSITWENSLDYAQKYPLLRTPESIQEAKYYFKDMGAWSKDEIDTWSDLTVQALLIQFVAGQIRELENYDNETAYFIAQADGKVSGNLYRDDDNKWFIYVGV